MARWDGTCVLRSIENMKYGDDASQIRISDITLVRDASSSPFALFQEFRLLHRVDDGQPDDTKHAPVASYR